MATGISNSQASILDRAFGADQRTLSPEVAEFLLTVRLDPQDEKRVNELAQLARDGSLTPDEQREIEEYRRAGRVMEMLKLRASAVLGHRP